MVRPVWRPGVFPEGQGNMAFQMARPDGGPDPIFTNLGVVEYVSDAPGELILLWVDYTSSFWSGTTWENRGDLIVRAPAGEARGYWAFSWGPNLVNSGRLIVEGQVYALAFQSWDGTDPLLQNSGQIVARSGGETNAVIFGNYARVVNSGYAAAFNSSPTYNAVGVQLLSGGLVENSGEIRAESTVATMRPRGVELLPRGNGARVENAGLIAAKDAIYENPFGAGVTEVVNQATGRIEGDVRLGDFADRVTNRGVISGLVDLGPGSDLYAGAQGRVTGGVFGGLGDDSIAAGSGPTYLRGDEGNDSIVGGSDFDDINGNMGDDAAYGGLGDDWVVGGKDQDLLFGDAGNDIVYGNLGADTCHGGDGADTIRGGQANDELFGGAGDDWLSGDRGDDIITGGAGADVFHTFGDAGLDRVTDFSVAEGDRVMLDPGTQYTTAQVGADTVISMTGGGQMVLVGVQLSSLPAGWIFVS